MANTFHAAGLLAERGCVPQSGISRSTSDGTNTRLNFPVDLFVAKLLRLVLRTQSRSGARTSGRFKVQKQRVIREIRAHGLADNEAA